MAIRAATRLVAPTAIALLVAISGMPDAAAATRPSAPRSVQATPGNTTVRITWTAPLHAGSSPVNRYAVQRAASATGPWSTVAKPAATTRAWKNTGLTNGTRYYYRVEAHNSAGWGAASTTASAVPRSVPGAPQSPTGVAGDGSAAVSWTAPADSGGVPVDAYRVQYSSSGTTWANLATVTVTHLTATSLTNGTLYHFRIRAHNAAGWGPASSEAQVLVGQPLPPTNLQGVSTSDGVTFSWTPSSTVSPAIVGYEVQMSQNDINWFVPAVHTLDANATQYHYSGTLGSTYWLRVQAVDTAAWSSFSDEASAVDGLPPCPVINLSATYLGDPLNEAGVDWSAPSAQSTCGTRATGYLVERRVDSGSYVQLATIDASVSAYPDSTVTHGHTYWYRITPSNELGSGDSREVQLVGN